MLVLAVLLVRQRKGFILGFLTALYVSVIVNSVMKNRALAQITVSGGLDSQTPLVFAIIQDVVSALAAIIADSLLVSIPNCLSLNL